MFLAIAGAICRRGKGPVFHSSRLAGKTLTVVTLEAQDIRPINSRMLPHIRDMAV